MANGSCDESMTGLPTPTCVVVGSGSAGRRHLVALARHLPEHRFVLVRREGSDQPLDSISHIPVELTSSLDEAVRHAPAIAVVANPAPFHVAASLALLDAGATVLVEKPLATTHADATRLAAHPKARSHLLVGYHLRHSDTMIAVLGVVESGRIGAPVEAEFVVGQHLSQWRPAVDPAASVTARAELGGGVLLELSHELDAARHLLAPRWGDVTTVEANLSTTGAPTDGIVDTEADLRLEFARGRVATVHLDMTSNQLVRRWTIVGDRGRLIADLTTGTVDVDDGATITRVATATPDERARAEDRLIAHLIDIAENGALPGCTVDDALAVLEIIESARAAASSDSATGPVTPIDGVA